MNKLTTSGVLGSSKTKRHNHPEITVQKSPGSSRPIELDCRYETICESCTMFFTTIEHRPTIQAQRDDADTKGQSGRRDVYDNLLRRLDDTPA